MIYAEEIAAVLADPEWTKRVVVAAATALNALSGPERTADGDDHRLPARSALRVAFTDTRSVTQAFGTDCR